MKHTERSNLMLNACPMSRPGRSAAAALALESGPLPSGGSGPDSSAGKGHRPVLLSHHPSSSLRLHAPVGSDQCIAPNYTLFYAWQRTGGPSGERVELSPAFVARSCTGVLTR
jgi:hypothetical protein